MSWWGPLTIAGGALAGFGISWALLGGHESSRARRRSHGGLAYEQAASTSELKTNVWPFLVLGGIVVVIVGFAVGLSAD